MDVTRVRKEVESGLSPVCATCSRYWEGKARGLASHCATEVRCGSPIAGDTFSDYQGPLTDFTRFCFACPSSAHQVVQVGDAERKIGVCQSHVSLLHELEVASKPADPSVMQVHTKAGWSPLLRVLPKPAKGLFQSIAEAEYEAQKADD